MTYLRVPHISGDLITFVADDDVWLVGADGGRAERLTSDRAPVSRPRLSPDGSLVAWTSRRDGNPEVYVAPVDGGPATRLTYWGHLLTRMLGWSADGRVIACSPARQPFQSRSWAYALPVDGGPPELLPYGPVHGIARGPATVLQTTGIREPATWKRYRGGTRGRFWIAPAGSDEFERFLSELDGQLADPVWLGDRLAFVSDLQGHGNVYSVRVDGTDLRRHSDHTGLYARDLAGDLEGGSTRIVYQRAGVIHRLDDLSADVQPVPLPIELPGARVGRQPFVAPVELAAEGVDVDETARASVVEVRGTVQWLTHRDGPVRALADSPGVRARLPRALPGREASAVWVTDADGDDALELSDGRRLASGRIGRVLELVVAPDAASAAVATHDGRVLVVALADGAIREFDRTEDGDARGLAFSPDSQWLAWSRPHPSDLRSIVLGSLADGSLHDVTTERFVDTAPVFTLDGKYLAFLSARTFDPSYDAQNFELSFVTGVRPYLVPLAAETPSPFAPQDDGRAVAAPAKDGDAHEPITVRVDVDGMIDRTFVAPVTVGLHSDLAAAEGGLLWLTHPITGEIGDGRPEDDDEPRPALWRWDFATRRASRLVENLDWFRVSRDGSRIVVRDGDTVRVGPSDRAVKPDPDDGPSDLVEVDLERVRVHVDPVAEWRQMLVETWRLTRDHFWIADMGGVDWDDVLARYEPLVDRLATRDDLSEVLWEMLGELGSSHAYERPTARPIPEDRKASFLGADLRREPDGRWRFTHVLPGESSVPKARSPLRSVGIRDGELLLEVNGHGLGPAGPAVLLAGLAGKPVELTLERDGVSRRVAVVPTADETPIRYYEWVAARRAIVHSVGQGRVGYVHIPDMMSTGWAEFHRDLHREFRRDAVVVDTRDNGGGHVSALVIERLARRAVGGEVARHKSDSWYPTESPRGPLVSLANEHAGSDGDIVNEAFRELGLGLIVGVRTWGGVIGIDGRYQLVDGSTVTQPRYSYWFRDAGWGTENYGVDPDVEVPHPPQAWAAGDDPQLTEGLRVVLEALDGSAPLQPTPLADRPNRAAPPLPPRP